MEGRVEEEDEDKEKSMLRVVDLREKGERLWLRGG